MIAAGGRVRIGKNLIAKNRYIHSGIPNSNERGNQLVSRRKRDLAGSPDVGLHHIVSGDVSPKHLNARAIQGKVKLDSSPDENQSFGFLGIHRFRFLDRRINLCFHERYKRGLISQLGTCPRGFHRVLHHIPREFAYCIAVRFGECLLIRGATGAFGLDCGV